VLAGIKSSYLATLLLTLGVTLVFGFLFLVLSISQSEWRWEELILAGFSSLVVLAIIFRTAKTSNREWVEARDKLVTYITSRFGESGISAWDIRVERISPGVWEGFFVLQGMRKVIILHRGETYQPTSWPANHI